MSIVPFLSPATADHTQARSPPYALSQNGLLGVGAAVMGSGATAGCVPRLSPRYGLEQLEWYDLVGQTKKSARKRVWILTGTPLLEISLSSKAVALLSSVAYFFLVL